MTATDKPIEQIRAELAALGIDTTAAKAKVLAAVRGAAGRPTRLVRLIRRPRLDLPGVLRLTPAAGPPAEFRLSELDYPTGRAFCLERLADEGSDGAGPVYVVVSPRGDDFTQPQDGDAGELLQAVRALIENGSL